MVNYIKIARKELRDLESRLDDIETTVDDARDVVRDVILTLPEDEKHIVVMDTTEAQWYERTLRTLADLFSTGEE